MRATGLWLALVSLLLASLSALAQTGGQPAPTPQRGPLGIAAPSAAARAPSPAAAEPAGIFARMSRWVQDKQSALHRDLVSGVKRLKSDSIAAAAGGLALVSFVYGVLHAIGPGHGKAIITSYALASERTARRGVALAFLSALFQALSAIVLVAILALALRATKERMQLTEAWLETVSAALVVAFGGWLLWQQVRKQVWPGVRPSGSDTATHARSGSATASDPEALTPAPAHAAHAHAHAGHIHTHHEHDEHCAHQHLPGPAALAGDWSWKRSLALAFTVGLRPCSGAIIVLVFALTQGVFWAGVGATFAMALGTAITVSALVLMAVGGRELAARLGGGGSVWAGRVRAAAGVGGSALLLLFGLLLLSASLGPARPF